MKLRSDQKARDAISLLWGHIRNSCNRCGSVVVTSGALRGLGANALLRGEGCAVGKAMAQVVLREFQRLNPGVDPFAEVEPGAKVERL